MPATIHPIRLPLPLGMGSVNCYLIDTGAGFVLIDTGGVNNRQALLGALEAAGCRPGLLKLILLTHGDFDHSGNAASLRQAFGARIAMHAGDAGMVEGGDMFAGRKPPNPLIRLLLPAFSRFGKAERFTPDVLLAEGDDLAAYGLAARILAIPGHSKGSIALLTAEGDLFCGDLLVNLQAPGLNSLIDDAAQAQASLRRLSGLEVRLVYPGHGGPFPLDQVQPGRS